MTNNSDTSPETNYNEILEKLDALLRKHQSKPPASDEAHANATFPDLTLRTASEEFSLTAADNIPTLTEAVFFPSAMLSPQSDITSLLEQILDSALKDAGVDLDTGARNALIQALECRLFGL
jgi:DNA-binding response OmpR family regulator